jgi:hypothetical protein
MMKQRAGLGKKVSSIFDGVPLPNVTQGAERPSKHSEPQLPPVQRAGEEIAPRQMPSVPQIPSRPAQPAPAQPQRPAVVVKPQTIATDKPILKVNTIAVTKESISGDAWRKLVNKYFASGDSELDARNRKAVAMMGVLFVVLVAVLWWTGIFSGGSNRSATSVASAANNDVSINWSIPQLLPPDLPDLMTQGSKNSRDGSVLSISGAPVVKAIVFSDNPTAVINGQIVRPGQQLEGTDITISKIYKDKVEFSQNGKSWTQQVE